eukprot:TRINITY_DN50136_c0_g1_i1.p1 TRINITY_DN50136_c0_g1~~TRINITY_DN50136_c0_g1_i1.p1  ORF type:complete len:199 (-),score=21.10 TRINITY_DN50136_c0_g1_i1:46-642(-)
MGRKSVGPIKFHKVRIPKLYRSPVIYGWQHNIPWSKYNNFAWFQTEQRPIRKTVVNHTQRVNRLMAFGDLLEKTPSILQELSLDGPYTLFCPDNEAMDMIKPEAWEKLWDEDRAKFVRHHCLTGKWGIADLAAVAAGEVEAPMSMANQPLPISVTGALETMDREVRVGGATVMKSNVRCWNGYVHIINKPLIPRWYGF